MYPLDESAAISSSSPLGLIAISEISVPAIPVRLISPIVFPKRPEYRFTFMQRMRSESGMTTYARSPSGVMTILSGPVALTPFVMRNWLKVALSGSVS